MIAIAPDREVIGDFRRLYPRIWVDLEVASLDSASLDTSPIEAYDVTLLEGRRRLRRRHHRAQDLGDRGSHRLLAPVRADPRRTGDARRADRTRGRHPQGPGQRRRVGAVQRQRQRPPLRRGDRSRHLGQSPRPAAACRAGWRRNPPRSPWSARLPVPAASAAHPAPLDHRPRALYAALPLQVHARAHARVHRHLSPRAGRIHQYNAASGLPELLTGRAMAETCRFLISPADHPVIMLCSTWTWSVTSVEIRARQWVTLAHLIAHPTDDVAKKIGVPGTGDRRHDADAGRGRRRDPRHGIGQQVGRQYPIGFLDRFTRLAGLLPDRSAQVRSRCAASSTCSSAALLGPVR